MHFTFILSNGAPRYAPNTRSAHMLLATSLEDLVLRDFNVCAAARLTLSTE